MYAPDVIYHIFEAMLEQCYTGAKDASATERRSESFAADWLRKDVLTPTRAVTRGSEPGLRELATWENAMTIQDAPQAPFPEALDPELDGTCIQLLRWRPPWWRFSSRPDGALPVVPEFQNRIAGENLIRRLIL